MPTTNWRDLIALADRLEPRLAREYLAAIARLRVKTDTGEIARAIAEGRPYFIPSANLTLFEQAMDPLVATTTAAVQQAGQLAADRFTDDLGLTLRFDLTNPLAIEVARQTAAGMVTRISAETRLALQNIIRRAIEEGITYRDAAVLIRQVIGLTAQASQAVLNYRAALLELGLSREKAAARIAAYAATKLRERALTISRTELINSVNAGQIAAWRDAAQRNLIPPDARMIWITTPDDRICPRCLAMDGMTVPIWSSFPGGNPALHPNCRCALGLVVDAAGAKRHAA